MVVLSGPEAAKLLKITNPDQVQPNGVDLTLDVIYRFPEEGPDFLAIDEDRVTPIPLKRGGYRLTRGAYLVEYTETTTIPPDCVGLLLPRSTLLRHGLDVRTALWDAGYSGKPKSLLISYRRMAFLPRGFRIGQLILIRVEGVSRTYRGRYHGESSLA